MTQTARKIRRIIAHHSASAETTTPETIDKWHRARGFHSLGYHYVIYRDAEGAAVIQRGRSEAQTGAHCKGSNSDSIGITVCGSYEDGGAVPDDLWSLLISTIEDLCRAYGLTEADVYGHKECARSGHPTACPGYSPDALRADVAELLTAPVMG